MRTEEAAGKSPLYRPRSSHEIRQSFEKEESKRSTCFKNEKKAGEVAEAPLIICPQAGDSLTKLMKTICKKFNINFKVVTRGGEKMTRDVK